MVYTGYELLWLFLCYSFLGWVLETIAAALKQKRFVPAKISMVVFQILEFVLFAWDSLVLCLAFQKVTLNLELLLVRL